MEAETSAPMDGDTSMLTGGFNRLSGVLITPAIIFTISLIKEMTAKMICYQSWWGSAVSTYIADPASAHNITAGVASGKSEAKVTPAVPAVTALAEVLKILCLKIEATKVITPGS